MLRRTVRAGALLALLTVALSACDLTVRIGTSFEPDGSGEFSLAVELDAELVEGLQQAAAASPDETSSISTLEELFAGLERSGWETSRRAPGGGLVLEARRAFADEAGFERALAELAGAGRDDAQPVDLASLELDYQVTQSFLRTDGRFDGTIDLGFGDDVDPIVEQLADVLADTVHFEIRTRLPGETTVREGGGTIEGDGVVWRPRIGTVTTFLADSSQLRAGSLLMILIPVLLIVALIGWLLMGRRAPAAELAPEVGPAAEVESAADLEPVAAGELPTEGDVITLEPPAVVAEVHHNGARAFAGEEQRGLPEGDDGFEQRGAGLDL